jgi:hypothetical protein
MSVVNLVVLFLVSSADWDQVLTWWLYLLEFRVQRTLTKMELADKVFV